MDRGPDQTDEHLDGGLPVHLNARLAVGSRQLFEEVTRISAGEEGLRARQIHAAGRLGNGLFDQPCHPGMDAAASLGRPWLDGAHASRQMAVDPTIGADVVPVAPGRG